MLKSGKVCTICSQKELGEVELKIGKRNVCFGMVKNRFVFLYLHFTNAKRRFTN